MIDALILAGILLVLLVLNFITSKQILESSMLSPSEKKIALLMIWLLPVIGALLAVSRLKRDAELFREKADQEMIEKLNELTTKIDGMREAVEQQKKSKLH